MLLPRKHVAPPLLNALSINRHSAYIRFFDMTNLLGKDRRSFPPFLNSVNGPIFKSFYSRDSEGAHLGPFPPPWKAALPRPLVKSGEHGHDVEDNSQPQYPQGCIAKWTSSQMGKSSNLRLHTRLMLVHYIINTAPCQRKNRPGCCTEFGIEPVSARSGQGACTMIEWTGYTCIRTYKG